MPLSYILLFVVSCCCISQALTSIFIFGLVCENRRMNTRKYQYHPNGLLAFSTSMKVRVSNSSHCALHTVKFRHRATFFTSICRGISKEAPRNAAQYEIFVYRLTRAK